MLIMPVALAVIALQQAAAAPPVEWIRQPPVEYPERALSQNVRRGRVVLSCRFEASVAVECVVVTETPAEMGFAAAALRAVRRGVAAPGVEGVRSVSLNFALH
jgi:outer membrane biosynthesis protein TonB